MLNNPLAPQTIGDPACPILRRWTLFPPFLGSQSATMGRGRQPRTVPNWVPKLLLHHFMPNADERHLHDHPRPFVTIVLRGGYDDLVPCIACDGTGQYLSGGFDISEENVRTYTKMTRCRQCEGRCTVLGDRMRPGMVRYRRAQHTHRTRVHKDGCWTVVIMGPLQRPWGFWVDGKWMFWKKYADLFGHGMRCS